jgi:hypothetical protein
MTQRILRNLKITGATALACALLAGTAGGQPIQQTITSAEEGEETVLQGHAAIRMLLENWESEPAERARELVEQYGRPDEVTRNRLIWHNNGPWKRTEIVNEEVTHNFPRAHNDFLYQTVEFPVPEEKVGEIAGFSGSILIDRVKGELTARCDTEKANMVTLNLVNQIIDGRKNAKSARDTFAETMLEDKHQDLGERLHFTWQQFEEPADPGTVYGSPDREESESNDNR